MVGGELHDDGTRGQVFAPGYGEFRSAGGGDLEAMALAVPTDAAPGPEPAELGRLLGGAERVYRRGRAQRWRAAAAAPARSTAAWRAHRAGGVPPRLVDPDARALARLDRAVAGRRPDGRP